MADLESFIAAPSEEGFQKFTKEQLLRLREHNNIDIKDKNRKENIRTALKSKLMEARLLEVLLLMRLVV